MVSDTDACDTKHHKCCTLQATMVSFQSYLPPASDGWNEAQ